MHLSICWDCKRALPNNGCCWADKFKPVDGWDATPTVKLGGNGYINSFHVYKCPLFVRSEKRVIKPVLYNVFKHTFPDGQSMLQIYNGVLEDAKNASEMRPYSRRWDKIKHEIIVKDVKYSVAVAVVKELS